MFPTCEECGQQLYPRLCPHCGVLVDDATPIDGPHRHPVPGAVSVCLYCAGLSIYTETGFRLPEGQEWDDLLNDPDIQGVIEVMAAMRAEGKLPPE